MQPEIYRTVKDFPDYEVSNYGNVRSWKNKHKGRTTFPHKLSPCPNTKGYLSVNLKKNKKSYSERVHVLVLKAFSCDRPEGYYGCHNNGIKTDNRLENLRWDTPKSNAEDMIRHGNSTRGEKSWRAKLKNSDIIEIRLSQENQSVIAERYGVARSTISSIKNKLRWGHI